MKHIAIITLAAAVLAMGGCTKKSLKSYILATGGTSGTYYPFGSAIAAIWNANIDGTNVTIQATGASAENLRLISAGLADFGIVQNDVMDYAFHGSDMFDASLPKLTAIGTLYPEVVHVATSKKSNIKTIADLRGKRVSVGDAGSGVEFNAKQLLESYGMTFDDIQKSNLSFRESAEKIQNDTLDACFVTSGVPNAALEQLAFAAGLELLPIGEAEADRLCDKYGFYTKAIIPAGTYSGTDTDVAVLAVKAMLAVNEALDTDTVYTMTRVLFESLDTLTEAHEKGCEVSAAAAVTGVSVPFHPGALKYFKEIGLTIR